jgi:hypothetical protein
MNHWVNWLATVLAAGAALMTGMIGAWHTLPVLTLGLRCLVAGILVFAFVRAGGEFAGRALLEGLAEHELRHEKRERERRERPEPSAQMEKNDRQERPAHPARNAETPDPSEEPEDEAGGEESPSRQAA